MLDDWFLIANPFSNSGKAAKVVQKVAKELDRVGVEFKINLTSYPGEEIALVDKATSNGYSRILAVGGDGTAQKVVAVYLLKYITPYSVVLTYNLEPIYGIILALLFFGDNEKMSIQFYIGLFIILTSVLINMYVKKRSKQS